MSEDFNPYRQWLELNVAQRPESDYELLRLRDFENDQPSIQAAADRAIAKVRGFRPGANAAAWSQLLDELTSAKRRLTDLAAKAEYDAALRSQKNNGSAGAGEGNQQRPTNPSPQISPASDNRYPPGMSGPMNTPTQPASVQPTSPQQDSYGTSYSSTSSAANPIANHGAQPLGSVGFDYSNLGAPQPGPAPISNPQPAPQWGYGGQPNGPYAQPTAYVHPQALPAQPSGNYGNPQAGNYSGQQPSNGWQGQPIPSAMPVANAYPQQMPGGYYPAQPNFALQPAYGTPPGYATPSSYGTATGYGAPQSPPPAYSPAENYLSDYQNAQTPQVDPMAAVDPMAPMTYGTEDAYVAEQVYSAPKAVAMGTAVATTASVVMPTPSGLATGNLKSLEGTASTDSPAAEANGPKVSGPSASQAAASRSQSMGLVTMLVGAAGAAIVLLVVMTLWNSANTEQQLAQNDPPVVQKPIPPPSQTKKKADRPEPRPMPQPQPRPEPRPMPQPSVEVKKVEVMPVPEDPAPEPMPEPTPTPVPMPEPIKLPTKQEVAELSAALATARIALTEANIDEAQAQLAKVESLPKLPEHQAKFERMKMLTDYNGQFWHAVDEAVKTFKSGSELMVGSQVLVVVEAGPGFLILRIAGMNKRYPLADLPAGIAVAVADNWFKPNDPAARVMKGAYAAVNRAGNVDKAREWWQQSGAEGVDTKALLPVLEDTYDTMTKDLDQAIAAQAKSE